MARFRRLILRFRPHRACLDGEKDGVLTGKCAVWRPHPARLDGEGDNLVIEQPRASYSPSRQAGWGLCIRFHATLLARRLVHHPHEADGVHKGRHNKFRFAVLFWAALCSIRFCFAADEPTYQGAARCIDCHSQPNPLRQRDGTTDWVTLTEAHTWLTIDKHSQAFDVLQTEYSQAIGQRLGIGDVTNDQSCLSCHAGWTKGLPAPPRVELGVSCEACHGPSSLYDAEHTRPAWRTKTADEKAGFGMVDVRHPRLRAEQCLSCHLGNAAEGKLLTHDMYAAGHPPLAGFELATFAQAMPPHWREFQDKGEAVRDNPDIRQAVGYRDGDVSEIKATIVGGVVALRESARLESGWRAAAANSGDWPDFAQYDCAACHHELERPSWRQARPATGRPGQRFPPVWPTVLSELALRHIERHDANEGRRFRRDLERQATGAGDLSDTLAELLRQLDDLSYDRAAAVEILRDIAELGQQPYLDFDSARQLAWAFRSIYVAIEESQTEDRPLPVPLAELSELLQLDLPSTRRRTVLDPQRRQALFRTVGDYQPNLANAIFAKLAELLSER
jgi:hypothetical protein